MRRRRNSLPTNVKSRNETKQVSEKTAVVKKNLLLCSTHCSYVSQTQKKTAVNKICNRKKNSTV